jgi:single-strand DNA-binding protein
MSKGYNRQIIVGNLGKDAELRHVGDKETAKASFSVAATTGFGKHEHTEWFDVVAWGKLAEGVHPYLTKGTKVLVEGETRTRSWEDDEGQKRFRTEVIVTPYNGQVVLLGGGNGNAPDDPVEPEEDEILF